MRASKRHSLWTSYFWQFYRIAISTCSRISCRPSDIENFYQNSEWVPSATPPFLKSVSWYFEPSQPQRITSGLNTNFTLSPSYSFHRSSYYKSCFVLAYLYSADTQHGNLPPAGWPVLFCGPTQEPCVRHSQHRKSRERFWKKMQVNWSERKQGRNPWQ